MFSADATFQFGALAASTFDTQLHQLANAFLVKGVERVGGDDLFFDVVLHDGVDVVAAEAEGHLSEVVGAEAEEEHQWQVRNYANALKEMTDKEIRAFLVYLSEAIFVEQVK